MKRYRKTLLITSLITLLPMLIGLILWNRLPEQMPIHWNFSGTADNFGSPAIAVIVLPLILLAAHWLCFRLTMLDKRNARQHTKPMSIVLYIFPFVSLLSCLSVYAAALGHDFNPNAAAPLLLGGMFILIGNYLPKCRLNSTLGVKLPWTLANEENWNLTHRFSGRVCVIGGAVMLFSALLPESAFAAVMTIVLLLTVGLPVAYSYRLYRKMKAEGRWEVNGVVLTSREKRIALPLIIVILPLTAVLMFTGNITFTADESSLEITAAYWPDSSIPYAEISSIEYRGNGVDGMRTNGFGSARLLMGQFRNDEFGYYTRYTYTGNRPAIVLTAGERTLVIGAKDAEATRALYDELTNLISDN